MPKVSETTAIAETSSGAIEYADLGSGPPVLVIHGTPGGHDQGAALGRCLIEAGFRVIAPSRPGYLGTALSSGRGVTDQADLYAALLDALGLGRVGVLCWSGGGPSAYRFAVQHRTRVTALVAVAAVSGAFRLRTPSAEERVMMGTAVGRGVLALMARGTPRQLIAATIAAEGRLDRAELQRRTEQVSENAREREFVLTLARTANYSGARRAGHDNDETQLAGIDALELDRIDAPALLVHGLLDSDVPVEHSRAAAAAIRTAALVELPAGTHLAFWINPAAPPVRERAFALLRRHAD